MLKRRLSRLLVPRCAFLSDRHTRRRRVYRPSFTPAVTCRWIQASISSSARHAGGQHEQQWANVSASASGLARPAL